MTASALDDVPGLGPARRTALLKHFGSLKRLRAASVEEIASVRGMGERTAQAVVAALGGGTTDDRPSQDTPAQDEAAARA
ncbi:Excinuclease ABC subunit C [Mycobacteroides abscessus]|nr:Excinuclease ABC subunit C [Mycobacteroides abscessus]